MTGAGVVAPMRARLPHALAVAVPALTLCAVAALQLWLAHASQLTPWSGGGFGMFSTIDGLRTRHIHSVVLGPGWRQELEIPLPLQEDAARARALPDERRLRRLGEQLLARSPGAERVELRVFAARFDPETLQPAGAQIAVLDVERDGP